MAQHSGIIPNQPYPDYRQDHIKANEALRSCNSGNTPPPNPVMGLMWLDTSTTPATYRVYNSIGNWDYLYRDGESVSTSISIVSPKGSVIPAQKGIFRLNTTTNDLWLSTGTSSNQDWILINNNNDSSGMRSAYYYGAVGDGITDDTVALQNAINDCSLKKIELYLPAGYYLHSGLTIKTNTVIRGAGQGLTTLKLKNGSNKDTFLSENFATGGHIYYFRISDLTIDGGYLDNPSWATDTSLAQGSAIDNVNWTVGTNVIANSLGSGIKFIGYGHKIENIEIKNCAENFIFIDNPISYPRNKDRYGYIKNINAFVCGKEGIVYKSSGDAYMYDIVLGLAGILPRPTSDTVLPVSTLYPTENGVHGILFDTANVELHNLHVFACWAGTGIKSIGTCRLHGSNITSEANRSQIHLSNKTYGYFSGVSTRNIGLLHPNWAGTIPTITVADPRYDAITIESDAGFLISNLVIFRTTTLSPVKRVVGARDLILTSASERVNINGLVFSNSTAPAGDPEGGTRFSSYTIEINGQEHIISSIGAKYAVGDVMTLNGSYCRLNGVITGQTQTVNTTGSTFINNGNHNYFHFISQNNAVRYGTMTGGTNTVVEGSMISDPLSIILTASSNTLTINPLHNRIFINNGTSGSVDIHNITAGYINQRLMIQGSANGGSYVFKNNFSGGNLRIGADRTINTIHDYMELRWAGSQWQLMSYENNA